MPRALVPKARLRDRHVCTTETLDHTWQNTSKLIKKYYQQMYIKQQQKVKPLPTTKQRPLDLNLKCSTQQVWPTSLRAPVPITRFLLR